MFALRYVLVVVLLLVSTPALAVSAKKAAAELSDCELAASSSYEAGHRWIGRDIEEMHAPSAIALCERALASNPKSIEVKAWPKCGSPLG